MEFKCFNDEEEWLGKIDKIKNNKSNYEFFIYSRSSIFTILGVTSRGYFACFPDFNKGCHLVDLKDVFWNTEKLVEVLGKADGLTVSFALSYLNKNNILRK
jgi:hypothetical protein